MTPASVRSRRGQTMVEYGLAIALITIIAILAMLTLGGTVSGIFTSVNSTVSGGASATATPAPGGPDTDGDGLSDTDETGIHNTDPNNPDTDGDGYSDGDEITALTDPLDPDDPGVAPAGPWSLVFGPAYTAGRGLSVKPSDGTVFFSGQTAWTGFFQEYAQDNTSGPVGFVAPGPSDKQWDSSAVDLSGNVYAAWTDLAGNNIHIDKYSPSGSILWTTKFDSFDDMNPGPGGLSENAGGIFLAISPDGGTLYAAGTEDQYGNTGATFDGIPTDGLRHGWMSRIDIATGAHSDTTVFASSGDLYGIAASNDALYIARLSAPSWQGATVERRAPDGSQVWEQEVIDEADGYGNIDAHGPHSIAYAGGSVLVTGLEYSAGDAGRLFSLAATDGSANWDVAVERGGACLDDNFVGVSGSTVYLLGTSDTFGCDDSEDDFDAPITMAAGETLTQGSGGTAYVMGFNLVTGAQTVGAREIGGVTASPQLRFNDFVIANGGYGYASVSTGMSGTTTLVRFLLPTN